MDFPVVSTEYSVKYHHCIGFNDSVLRYALGCVTGLDISRQSTPIDDSRNLALRYFLDKHWRHFATVHYADVLLISLDSMVVAVPTLAIFDDTADGLDGLGAFGFVCLEQGLFWKGRLFVFLEGVFRCDKYLDSENVVEHREIKR